MMFKTLDEHGSGALGRWLHKQGIAIRDLSSLPGCGPGFYRLGLRLRDDNQRLLAALRRYEEHDG